MISAISAMRNMTRYPEPGMTARPISAVAVPPMGTPDIISVATMAQLGPHELGGDRLLAPGFL
jgi:hypothetical protein